MERLAILQIRTRSIRMILKLVDGCALCPSADLIVVDLIFQSCNLYPNKKAKFLQPLNAPCLGSQDWVACLARHRVHSAGLQAFSLPLNADGVEGLATLQMQTWANVMLSSYLDVC